MQFKTKSFIGRIIVFLGVAAIGPFLYWLGGGTERSLLLVMVTLASSAIGLCISGGPIYMPWED